jgi:hypothetical protein
LLDNFLIISDNGIDVSTIKILEIIENSIICKNKVFSTEESFYGFTLENQTLNFYSNNKNIITKHSLNATKSRTNN